MRVVDVEQGSEAWENLRRGVPTASNFGRIITPAKADLSTKWPTYAAELIAESLLKVTPPAPTFWMAHGTEMQPYAIKAYETLTGSDVQEVGFVWPDEHEKFGCSPDGLVGDSGLIEVKCPMPQTLLGYHLEGVLPMEYKPQVMGQLLITGREWCDFVGYHPELRPFVIRVQRDDKYIAALWLALEEFCERLAESRAKLQGVEKFVDVSITDDYQPITYESGEVEL